MVISVSGIQNLSVSTLIEEYGSVANAQNILANRNLEDVTATPVPNAFDQPKIPETPEFNKNPRLITATDSSSNNNIEALLNQIDDPALTVETGFLTQVISQAIEDSQGPTITESATPAANDNGNSTRERSENALTEPLRNIFNLLVSADAYKRVQAVNIPETSRVTTPAATFSQQIVETTPVSSSTGFGQYTPQQQPKGNPSLASFGTYNPVESTISSFAKSAGTGTVRTNLF